jgi:hypothetical protein
MFAEPSLTAELLESLASRGLLGGFLRRAGSHPDFLPVDRGRAGEAPVVRRSLDREDSVGDRLSPTGELFLELRLEVNVTLDRVLDPVGERVHDRLLNRLEPVLEVESPETSLDERREDVPVGGEPADLGALALRGVLAEPLSQREPLPDDGAALARNDMGADLCEMSLLVRRKALVELTRDREPENAVPQELEALVGFGAVSCPRGMGERLSEALRGQLLDQPPEVALGLVLLTAGGSRCSRRLARLSESAERPRPRS